jgi:SAM-dependent methyltransferase
MWFEGYQRRRARGVARSEPPVYEGRVKRTAPAALRNRDLLAATLRDVLPPGGTLLEIGSGTGEHAVHLARLFPQLAIQPSDPDAEARASVEAWAAEARLPNLRAPLSYDLLAPAWRRRRVDALLCVNVLHVSPPEAVEALAAGAAEILAPGGPLAVYGPFAPAGSPLGTRLSRIDRTLRAADARYGVRDPAALAAAAARHGLSPVLDVAGAEEGDRVLVFRRS